MSGPSRKKKFDEEQFREERRARRAKAILLFDEAVILLGLVLTHVALEKTIVWGMGRNAIAERVFSALTWATILPCYVANCWEMVLLFWPSFKKRPGGES